MEMNFVPIFIEEVVLKKGTHRRMFLEGSFIDNICVLSKSKRDFDKSNFHVEEGCIITTTEKSYIVLSVHNIKRYVVSIKEIEPRLHDIEDLKVQVKLDC